MKPNTKKPTLVLLPGLDGTGILFRPFLAALPDGVDVRVVSYPSDRMLSLDEYAAYAAARIPESDAVLLAESFSGLVALRLLASGIPAVTRVIFVAAFAQPPRPRLLALAKRIPLPDSALRSAPDFLLRAFCLGPKSGPAEFNLLREALAAVPAKLIAHRLRLVAETSDLDSRGFSVPCHYLQATRDRLVPHSASHWFRDHFESCQVEPIAGPHFLLQARPAECAARVAAKLSGTPAA